MARIAPIDPAAATGRVKEIFDGPLKGKHFNMFRSMAQEPAALQAYLGMAGALSHGCLSAKEREVVQLAIGEANGCAYCVAAHTAIGRGAGLSDEQMIGARRGSVADARLNALVRFAMAIHEKKGHVSDTDLAAFRGAGFGDAHIAQVVAEYGLAVFTNTFNHVAQPAVDFPAVPGV